MPGNADIPATTRAPAGRARGDDAVGRLAARRVARDGGDEVVPLERVQPGGLSIARTVAVRGTSRSKRDLAEEVPAARTRRGCAPSISTAAAGLRRSRRTGRRASPCSKTASPAAAARASAASDASRSSTGDRQRREDRHGAQQLEVPSATRARRVDPRQGRRQAARGSGKQSPRDEASRAPRARR